MLGCKNLDIWVVCKAGDNDVRAERGVVFIF